MSKIISQLSEPEGKKNRNANKTWHDMTLDKIERKRNIFAQENENEIIIW